MNLMVRVTLIGLLFLCLGLGEAWAQKVKVISPGTGTLQQLKYRPVKGTAGMLRIALDMTAGATVDGVKVQKGTMPTLRYRVKAKVTQVDSKGNFSLRFTIRSATVKRLKDLPPSAVKKFHAELAKLKKIRVTVRFSATGVHLSSKADGKKVKDALLYQLAQFLIRTLEQVVIPLPTEKVGVGAVWLIEQKAKLQGISMKSETRYRLKSFAGKRFAVGIRLKQKAKKQKLTMGPRTVDLKRFEGTGKGEYVTGPSVVAPIATFSLKTGYKLVGSHQGKSQKVEVDIAYAFKLNVPGK